MAAVVLDETESIKKLFNSDSKEWLQSVSENNNLLEEWLSTPMTEAKITTAAPIVATTITLEAIQSLLYSNGFSVTDGKMECFGPFEDTQFDAVVDVETSSQEKQGSLLTPLHKDNNSLEELSEQTMPDCSDLSEFSEDDLTLLTDMVMSDSDLDLSSDSGIEAEIEDASEHNFTKKPEKSENSRKRKNNESENECNKKSKKSTKRSRQDDNSNEDPNASCQYLWEFLHHLLISKRYEKCIAWKNAHKGVFRMVDHHMVAKLWGKHKKRKNMTYDKLSRALRYYYAKNILAKVNGQRLTYKFCRDPSGRKYPS